MQEGTWKCCRLGMPKPPISFFRATTCQLAKWYFPLSSWLFHKKWAI
jgi:hypothetical protein